MPPNRAHGSLLFVCSFEGPRKLGHWGIARVIEVLCLCLFLLSGSSVNSQSVQCRQASPRGAQALAGKPGPPVESTDNPNRPPEPPVESTDNPIIEHQCSAGTPEPTDAPRTH